MEAQNQEIFYNNGLSKVAVCKSSITDISAAGKLTYYGITIEELIEKHSYPEVFTLLTTGKLPSATDTQTWTTAISLVPDPKLDRFLDSFSGDVNPMVILSAVVIWLSGEMKNKTLTNNDYAHIWSKCLYSLLYLMKDFNYDDHKDVLDKMFTLHADLALNCSTFALRTAASADASLFASIAAGIDALSGPKHGSANLFVLEQLENLYKSKQSVNEFINESLRNKQPIWGFGHRVFRTYDPRAVIIKDIAKSLVNAQNQEFYNLYEQLETAVVSNPYFKERGIYTNVDYWTSFVYNAIGVPKIFMPCMFAIARIPGWIAHYNETINDKETKIVHPQQIYIGK